MSNWQIPPVVCKVHYRTVDLPGEPADHLPRLSMAGRPFLLDSAARHSRWGRFSYLGCNPLCSMTYKSVAPVKLEFGPDLVENGCCKALTEDPWQGLSKLCTALNLTNATEAAGFQGGLIGYFSYDLGRCIERLPELTVDDISLPDLYLNLYDCWASFDHGSGQWSLGALEFDKGSWLDSGKSAAEKMDRLAQLLSEDVEGFGDWPREPAPRAGFKCSFSKDEYLSAVQRGRDYIAAGDIFQVNLSQRFTVDLNYHPAQAYLKLRQISPAWFAAYMQWEDKAILSSSPELFLRRCGQEVITRPIKGTRPRKGQAEHDKRMRNELAQSLKDSAELNMIVDLERNDLGRVCDYGSVQVEQHRQMEEHPTVFHLVSTVTGRLVPWASTVDLLRATFPGGSITGAPKVRAMEIIEELEPARRNVYTGAIGYIGLDGSCELNIAIRTIIVDGSKAHCQVGGAVVADSEPQAEYQETLDKGMAMMAVLRNMPLSELVFQ